MLTDQFQFQAEAIIRIGGKVYAVFFDTNEDGTGNFPTAATYEGMFVFDKAAGQKKPYVASASGYINILTENDSVGRHADVNISGVSNGDGLIFNSAQGRFNVGALPSTGFSIAMAVAL